LAALGLPLLPSRYGPTRPAEDVQRSFEVLDRTLADSRPLGEVSLRQAGGKPMLPQQRSEHCDYLRRDQRFPRARLAV